MNRTKKRILSSITLLAVAATATLGGLGMFNGSATGNTFNPIAYADATIVNKTSEEDATKYYVGTPAEGAEGTGTSAEDPMSANNFASRLAELKPGDIVYVMPGVHKLVATWALGRASDSEATGVYVNGSYDDYIIFTAYDPDQQTVLDFSEMTFASTNRGVHIYGDYYYWSNIDVCGAGDNGLYIGGNYNVVENCEFYNNRDTGLQLGRNFSANSTVDVWPNYNIIRNCTSHNNYDNETKGENADGFAAKLTVGYHNVFDGCIAYRNSDDGWDLYGKADTGIIGTVYMINCVAFENGFLETTQEVFNSKVTTNAAALEAVQNSYTTANGDGNGFKLGGSTLEGDVFMYNCYAFNNRMHGVTDNSNPGVISVNNTISYNNSALIDNDPASATFGQIVGCDTVHNNIDLARSELSYNNFTGVLSVFNGRTGQTHDAYIGSAENSLLTAEDGWYKITAPMDANTVIDTDKYGEEIVTQPAATEIFEELPAVTLGLGTSAYGSDLHEALRNDDYSVNMGNILKIKDYSVLGFEEGEIGADLSKASQAEYSDYDLYTFLTSATSSAEARAQALMDTIYVPVKTNAVYQDFDLASHFYGVNVTWRSSDPDIITIANSSVNPIEGADSGVRQARATVYRDIEGDRTVTLTATAEIDGIPVEKEFELTVKQNEYLVGDIVVDGVSIITNSLITTQYRLIGEPDVTVLNAADYNGKTLPEGSYELTKTYMYAASKGEREVELPRFTTSNAGVYTITLRVSIDDHVENVYSYTIYVVDQHATVDFVEDPTITVSYNSYIISGELNNVSGTLYSMIGDADLTIPEQGTPQYTAFARNIRQNGEAYAITTDTVTATFEATNEEEYTIYYVVCNPNGDATSPIYSTDITIQNISSVTDFTNLINSPEEDNDGIQARSDVIYRLTTDIDLSNVTWITTTNYVFSSYLDGDGHTVKNLTASGTSNGLASLMYRLDGGTIINLNFENFVIRGTGTSPVTNQVGIIGQAYSGNLVNIKMRNIDVHTTGQRVGGLIGQVFEANGTLPLIIDRVSLINDDGYAITAADRRAGGILGFVQVNSSPDSALVDIRISNCYVDSLIGDRAAVNVLNGTDTTTTVFTGEQFGGIVGTFDASSTGAAYIENFTLSISNCYFTGTTAGGNRVSGIIGYQQGITAVTVRNCVSAGDIYYVNTNAPIIQAEKNASGIFGGYVSTSATTVSGCFAKFEEDNSNYLVSVYNPGTTDNPGGDLAREGFWTISMDFDIANIWQFNAEQAPYMTLR